MMSIALVLLCLPSLCSCRSLRSGRHKNIGNVLESKSECDFLMLCVLCTCPLLLDGMGEVQVKIGLREGSASYKLAQNVGFTEENGTLGEM